MSGDSKLSKKKKKYSMHFHVLSVFTAFLILRKNTRAFFFFFLNTSPLLHLESINCQGTKRRKPDEWARVCGNKEVWTPKPPGHVSLSFYRGNQSGAVELCSFFSMPLLESKVPFGEADCDYNHEISGSERSHQISWPLINYKSLTGMIFKREF